MGGCISTAARAAKARSDEIDRWLEEDSKRPKRAACKVLLLGLRGSGKRTVAKQMKIFHDNGLSQAVLAEYRPVVYTNVLDLAQQMVRYMKDAGLECVEGSNKALVEKILSLEYQLDSDLESAPDLSPEIAEAIHQLSKDPVILKIMEESSGDWDPFNSAGYFFGEILRIGLPDYLPTEMDVLRARRKSVGTMDMRLTMGQFSIDIFEVGGQRSHRKKWIYFLEGVSSIIFCTALSGYDQVVSEEGTETHISESLGLFEAVVNSSCFLRTSIILFLTKIDVFKKKVPRVPLERSFPEYIGGLDLNKAVKFIWWKFTQVNRAGLSVYPHLIQATDTTKIPSVFAAVKETVLQNCLKESGIL